MIILKKWYGSDRTSRTSRTGSYGFDLARAFTWFNIRTKCFLFRHRNPWNYNTSTMFEFCRLYCAPAKWHAPFPFDGLLAWEWA